ncbi:hypothetical protein BG004_005175 [Podila humilis]|nr:hypothetical protein BG004_005175 [Podila humilis]
MKKARPNSFSVLPTHAQFKDKPLGGASPGTSAFPAGVNTTKRWTLRRVILGAGGLLFVYITLTTIFGTPSSTYSSIRSTTGRNNNNNRRPPPRPEQDLYNDIQLNNNDRIYGSGNDNNNDRHPGAGHKEWSNNNNNNNNKQVPEPVIEDKTPPKQQQQEEQKPAGSGSEQGTSDDKKTPPPPPSGNTDQDNGPSSPPPSSSQAESQISITSRQRLATGVSYAQVLAATKAERDYAIALIVKEANQALKSTEVYSVTNKNQTAPSRDIHDYLSLSKYYWPNAKSSDGLPYVRRDGHINPEIETVRDYRLMRTMMREVHMMGMAYHFTGDRAYADKCAMRLREWFLDEKTYMNPNINFGSLRKGEQLGARTGVLDMFPIFRVFDALHYLKQEPHWDPTLIPQLKAWFSRYVRWLETSTLAKVERRGNNNHGTYFDVQIIGIYLFLDRIDDARAVARTGLENRIDRQILPDGGQPEELERKTSWYYSVFNLQALMTLARWGDDLGVDMWHHQGPQGQSIKGAIDFLLPHSLNNGIKWPVTNLKGFDMTDYLKCLQIAWNIYGEQKYLDAIAVLEPKVRKDMADGKIKTISTFMCDMSTLLEAGQRGGQGLIWHWCLT